MSVLRVAAIDKRFPGVHCPGTLVNEQAPGSGRYSVSKNKMECI